MVARRSRGARVMVLLALGLAGLVLWWVGGRGGKAHELRPTDFGARRAAEEDAGPGGEGAGPRAPELVGTGRAGVGATPSGPVEPPIPEDEALRMVGRVVDGLRRPAVGVVVEPSQGAALGRTDAQGRFTVRLRRPATVAYERLSLVARSAAGEVAAYDGAVNAVTPAGFDVGVLTLLAGHVLSVEVRSEGQPVAGAEVWALAWDPISAGQLRARGRTDDTGRLALPPLPSGAHRVAASVAGRGRALAHVNLPRRETGPVVLDLSAPRSVEVTVVFLGDEAPVVGAQVEVLDPAQGPGWGSSPCAYLPTLATATTDDAGRARLEGLATQDAVLLRVQGGGVAPPPEHGLTMRGHPRVEANVSAARVLVQRLRRIRWPITAERGPRPAEGEVVVLRESPGSVTTLLPATARMEGEHLVAEGVGGGYVHAEALTPDGRVARLFAKDSEDVGNPASFRPLRKIEVDVLHEDGSVPQGLAVVARNQGGNVTQAPEPLDGAGRAVIAGLEGGLVEVYLTVPGYPWGQSRLGTVDLEAGDGKVSARVSLRRRALLKVRIDGVAALPGQYHLSAGFIPVGEVEEDPARGEIRFSWLPSSAGGDGQLSLAARGLLRADGRTGAFNSAASDRLASSGPEPEVVELDLVTGLTLHVDVLPPKDGRVQVSLERFDPEKGTWNAHPLPWSGAPPNPMSVGLTEFGPLAAGRYRAVERDTGLTSEPADLEHGRAPPQLTLDAREVGFVRGRVEVPEGFTFGDVRVRVGGLREGAAGSARRAEGISVWSKDGTFSIRVPGRASLTLEATHPLLTPDPDAGRTVVGGPCEGIVLRLVEGTLARLTLDPAPDPARVGQGPVAPRVLLFAEHAEGAPLHTCAARVEGGALAFGGYAPGTFVLWIDLPPHAPLLLGTRTLSAGRTDLGSARFSSGASVHLRVLAAEGQGVPRLSVSAAREGALSYTRAVNSRGEALIVLSGLAPGHHRLRVYPHMGGVPKARLDEPLDIAADSVTERTLDLR